MTLLVSSIAALSLTEVHSQPLTALAMPDESHVQFIPKGTIVYRGVTCKLDVCVAVRVTPRVDEVGVRMAYLEGDGGQTFAFWVRGVPEITRPLSSHWRAPQRASIPLVGWPNLTPRVIYQVCPITCPDEKPRWTVERLVVTDYGPHLMSAVTVYDDWSGSVEDLLQTEPMWP